MKNTWIKKELASKESAGLMSVLQERFEKNGNRHKEMEWTEVQARLDAHPGKLWSLNEMEATGGEPDVVGQDRKTGKFLFYDCSPETPKGRVSVCYDQEGMNSRKEHKPKSTAMDHAEEMGIGLLTEEEYYALQTLGDFDRKTSCWVKTPYPIRKLGGALYCERRYSRIFTGHNGAQSYYAVRGFRGSLKV